jgi:WD40 repeat protein
MRIKSCQMQCRELVTIGGDGVVKIFQVTASGGLGVCLRSIPLKESDAEPGGPAPLARALAIHPSTGSMLVGTASCDIWQISPDGMAETIIFGHRADVIGLAMNPKPQYSHIFATCSDSCKVAVWSLVTQKVVEPPRMHCTSSIVPLSTRRNSKRADVLARLIHCMHVQLIKVVPVAHRARCLAFAPNGELLAVGMHSGALATIGFHPTVKELTFTVPCTDAISTLSYSPDGKYLAAGSRDQYSLHIKPHRTVLHT